MRRHALSAALMSILLGACSSAPEKPVIETAAIPATSKENPQSTVTHEASNAKEEKDVAPEAANDPASAQIEEAAKPKPPITGHRWTTLEFKDQTSLVQALQEVGFSLGKTVAPSDTDAVINSEVLRGELLTIISDEEGVVISLYGKTKAGEVMTLVNADGSFVLSKSEGPVMEPVIRLSVTPRSGTENLGLTQKLALKQVLAGMGRDEVESVLANESIDISFKALFVQGRMVGPMEIVSSDRR